MDDIWHSFKVRPSSMPFEEIPQRSVLRSDAAVTGLGNIGGEPHVTDVFSHSIEHATTILSQDDLVVINASFGEPMTQKSSERFERKVTAGIGPINTFTDV